MNSDSYKLILTGVMAAILAGCGGGSGGSASSTMPTQQSSNLSVLVRDAAANLATLANALAHVGTPLKAYGVPLLDTSFKV